MSSEGFPATVFEQTATEQEAFGPDGLVNENYFYENFGIGSQEANQEVTWGSYTGTIAKMLTDAGCPVGDAVKTAFVERGIDGVVETFHNFAAIDSRFSVSVSEATLSRPRQRTGAEQTETPESKKK